MPKRGTLRLTKRIVERLKAEGKVASIGTTTWPASASGSTPERARDS